MNLDDLRIETTEVKIGKKEFEQRQVRLIAALLEIEGLLRVKDANYFGFSEANIDAINNQQKEAA